MDIVRAGEETEQTLKQVMEKMRGIGYWTIRSSEDTETEYLYSQIGPVVDCYSMKTRRTNLCSGLMKLPFQSLSIHRENLLRTLTLSWKQFATLQPIAELLQLAAVASHWLKGETLKAMCL